MRSNQLVSTARKLREYIESNAATLSDVEALEMPAAFPVWKPECDYAINDRVRHGDALYKCVQAHHAQADWSPEQVPALWVEVAPEGVIPEWRQPTGAQDAYMKDDKVKFQGQVYISIFDNNIWSPEVYGWELVEGE